MAKREELKYERAIDSVMVQFHAGGITSIDALAMLQGVYLTLQGELESIRSVEKRAESPLQIVVGKLKGWQYLLQGQIKLEKEASVASADLGLSPEQGRELLQLRRSNRAKFSAFEKDFNDLMTGSLTMQERLEKLELLVIEMQKYYNLSLEPSGDLDYLRENHKEVYELYEAVVAKYDEFKGFV